MVDEVTEGKVFQPILRLSAVSTIHHCSIFIKSSVCDALSVR